MREPITLDMRACFVLKAEQRAVSDYGIGGGSEDAVRVALCPDDVARVFCHRPPSEGTAPLWAVSECRKRQRGTVEPLESPLYG